MGKKSKPGSSVCKLLYDDDCTSIFQIPSRLVKSYGDELPQTATLRINHSEKCWRVSIENFKGQYFFTDGWKEFAEEVNMKTREYLLFRAAGLSEFHISPDESDDDKELNSGDYTENSEGGDSFSDRENSPRVGKSFTFTTELKSYHKQRLVLPRKFTKRAGLKTDKRLILQNVEGRQWPVRLTDRSCGRYALTAGWVDFLIANKVTVGSIMSFKFVSGSNKTMEARVIKQGTNKKALFKFVKRKGNRFEVFEPDKTSDLTKNLHTTSELGEGPENTHITSEPTEGPENLQAMSEHAERYENSHKTSETTEEPENLHAMSEHAEGPEYSHKTSEHTEEPENFHTMSEHVEGPKNSHKTSERTDRPENFHKTSDITKGPESLHTTSGHGEGPTNIHKTSGHAEGPEKSHANVQSESEDHFLEEDNDFGVERRWRFSKELKKHNAYKLDIPRDISKVIEKTTNEEIKLWDCKGRKWPVRMEYRQCGAYTMTSGWIDFLVGNKVYVGSTISFEFIPSRDTNVIEARVMENGEKGTELFVKRAKGRPPCRYFFTDGWKEFAKEVDRKTRDQTENSEDEDCFTDQDNGPRVGKSFTFTTELKSYHIHRLVLPKKITKRARLKKDKKFILQDVNRRQWPVRLTDRTRGRYALTAGWVDFLIANKVTVGSTMSFKIISGSNNTIEARVIKEGSNKNALFNFVKRKGDRYEVSEPNKTSDLASEPENLHTSEHGEGPKNSHNMSERTEGPGNFHKTSDITKGPENLHTTSGHGEGPENSHSTSGHVKGPQKSHANVKSENEDHLLEDENGYGVGKRWIFSNKQLKKHNAYKLDIPRDVSKVIEKATNGKIKLQDCKGRKWPVRLEYRKCDAYTMTSGWIDFLVGNKVYVGSTISFEFIPCRDNNVIEAQVIKNGEKGTELFVKRAKGRPPGQ